MWRPAFIGTKVLSDYSIAELVPYIDWTPFFATWELVGKYPAILDDAKVGEAARNLFADAQAMLARAAEEKWFRAAAVFGVFPAHSAGDDILVFAWLTERMDDGGLPALMAIVGQENGSSWYFGEISPEAAWAVH